MKNIPPLGLCIVLILGVLFISSCSQGEDYTIDGNSVLVNDSNIYLRATPHTLHHSDWVEVEFESKIFGGDIDIAFGFDTNNVKPTAVQRWNPHEENIEKEYTCNYDFGYNDTDFWCFSDDVNGTNTYFEHHYDRGNIPTKTAWWNETKNNDWSDFSGAFNSVNYDFDGKNKWYYKQGQTITAGQTYKIRFKLDIPYNSISSKYDIAIKPSSETIQEAIENDHFYFLDPWFDYDLNSELMAYYTFDDLDHSNSNVRDMTDQGRNGTINGGLTTGAPGLLGEAFVYENSITKFTEIDAVDIAPLTSNPVPAPGWAINFWANVTDLTSENSLMGNANHDAANSGWSIRIANGDDDLVYIGHHGASWPDVSATCTNCIDINDWVMLTLSRNATDLLWYKNGALISATSDSDGAAPGGSDLRIGQSGTKSPFDGKLDELGFWNRTLTTTEITGLYNGGAGLEYMYANITTISNQEILPNPADGVTPITCSADVTAIADVLPMDFDAVLNWSNSTDWLQEDTFSDLASGSNILGTLVGHTYNTGEKINCTIFAYFDDEPENSNTTASVNLTIINIMPIFDSIPANHSALHTVNVTSDYDCSDAEGDPLTYWVFNTTGDLITPLTTNQSGYLFADPVLEDTGNHTYNLTCGDGITNISNGWKAEILNSIPSIPNLVGPDNGTAYINLYNISLNCSGSVDPDGDTINYTFYNGTTPAYGFGQNSTATTFNWNESNSTGYWGCKACDATGCSATVNRTLFRSTFGICDQVAGTPIIEFTFIDEVNSSSVNGTANVDIDIYSTAHAGAGNIANYIYTNTTGNASYGFCITNADDALPSIADFTFYYGASGYVVRQFKNVYTLTTTLTNQILYLLSSSVGSYSSYHVQTTVGNALKEVDVTVERQIGGVWTEVSSGFTDGSGTIQFWLNPDYLHRFTFVKIGYTTVIESIQPTQASYVIQMDKSTSDIEYMSNTEGMLWFTAPISRHLNPGTTYDFDFNITTTLENIHGCKMELLDKDGTVLSTTTGCITTTSGDNLSASYAMINGTLHGRYSISNSTGTWFIIDDDTRWTGLDVSESYEIGSNYLFTQLAKWDGLGQEAEQAYSRIFFFYLFLVILLGILTYTTGFDLRSPFAGMTLVAFIVILASVGGFFSFDIVPGESNAWRSFFNTWAVALTAIFFSVGHALQTIRRKT